MENIPNQEVVEPKEKKQSCTTKFLLGVVITLLIIGISIVILYFFTDLKDWISCTNDESTEIIEEETEDDVVEEVTLENEGWGLFSLPEYLFTVEIPTYTITQKLGEYQEDISSFWTVKHNEKGFYVDAGESWYAQIHDELVDIVSLSFFPIRLPESVACGQGCVKEQSITVYIFEDSKPFNEIKAEYISSINDLNDSDEDIFTITTEDENKWGYETLKFHIVSPGGESSGYLLSNGEYSYHISYYFSSSPEESFEVAEKVLDSMKFE
jgi:hypothetical protein